MERAQCLRLEHQPLWLELTLGDRCLQLTTSTQVKLGKKVKDNGFINRLSEEICTVVCCCLFLCFVLSVLSSLILSVCLSMLTLDIIATICENNNYEILFKALEKVDPEFKLFCPPSSLWFLISLKYCDMCRICVFANLLMGNISKYRVVGISLWIETGKSHFLQYGMFKKSSLVFSLSIVVVAQPSEICITLIIGSYCSESLYRLQYVSPNITFCQSPRSIH